MSTTVLCYRDSAIAGVIFSSLSSDVFERRTSTGSEPFPLLISLDATIFVLPSVLILIETICPNICSKSGLKSAKRPLPVDVRRSKKSLLKLPNHLVQTLKAAQLFQNVCHSIEKCVQGNFTKKSYLALLYSLTRRNTPTKYRSHGIRVPGLQPYSKRVETHLQKISSFSCYPGKN